jgi:hypothetical protein
VRRPRLLIAMLVTAVATAGCLGPEDAPGPDGGVPSRPAASSTGDPSSEAADPSDGDPQPRGTDIRMVPRAQWRSMVAAGMVRPECPIQDRSQLRRVDLDFVDFNGEQRRGHLIVNRDIAQTVARIFETLHAERFPIAQMTGVETYGGDLNRSLAANNTSAYNCRRPDQIQAPFAESPHANGRAIDLNPVQNPWIDLRCDCWKPSPKEKTRTDGPGKITKGRLAWRLFTDAGWIWQNIDTPDYMHFDTGYPSTPYREPRP